MRDDELRRALQSEAETAPHDAIDSQRIVRRTRNRRVPLQVATGGAMSLALLGIGGVVVTNLPGTGMTAAGGAQPEVFSAPDDAGSPGDESAPDGEPGNESGPGDGGHPVEGPMTNGDTGVSSWLAPDYKAHYCGGILGESTEDEITTIDIDLDLVFPDSADAGTTTAGTVLVTNTGAEPIVGRLNDRAAMTLARGDTVQWHTSTPARSTIAIDLAPGESAEVPGAFDARICSEVDDMNGFRSHLPAASVGEHTLSATIDLELADGTVLQLVSGSESIRID